MRWWFWALAALVLLALAAGAALYLGDMSRIRSRVAAGSRIVETALGPVEIAERGEGPPVLLLHGAGGGYDQALFLAEVYAGGTGHRWIAISRMGYLRAPLPQDASTAAQADLCAALLDALGIARADVLAMSGGVPPALQFAARHPQRTGALVLLSSAPWTPMTAEAQDLPMPAWAYQALFSSDLPTWLMMHLWPAALEAAFDVTPARRAAMDAEDRAAVDRLVATFLPLRPRLAGLANEGAAIDPSARYDPAAIRAPTLVIHARDDGINPYPIGEATAAAIPGARLLTLGSGGHLLLGHLPQIRSEVQAFLGAAPAAAGPRPALPAAPQALPGFPRGAAAPGEESPPGLEEPPPAASSPARPLPSAGAAP